MFVCFLIIKNIDCEKPCGDEAIKCLYVLRLLSHACKITGIHVIIVFSDHLCTNLCKSHKQLKQMIQRFILYRWVSVSKTSSNQGDLLE